MNEFFCAILLSQNPIRSEDDYDMLKDINLAKNEDRTNGVAQDSMDEALIYNIMPSPKTIQNIEDTQRAIKPIQLEEQAISSSNTQPNMPKSVPLGDDIPEDEE